MNATRGIREFAPGGGLVLAVSGRPAPPPLRFETADAGRLLLRQGERPLLLGRADGTGCCKDLAMHRLDGHRSPLPPLRSGAMRERADWTHQYSRWPEEAEDGPLYDGRWLVRLCLRRLCGLVGVRVAPTVWWVGRGRAGGVRPRTGGWT
ncbi:hypothetical protein [Streptomyces sp. AS02]|uniref:hypothetical protein n=1 Tax=Streptomyces sp. AS02 TaxID=2938946 RepID=UPI0020201E6C|nr:hypothetical protein [Streptomyces sp. AS02]MCL8010355.1 hypothetical protein [Streptomyces sp. AS02]